MLNPADPGNSPFARARQPPPTMGNSPVVRLGREAVKCVLLPLF